MKVPHLRRLFKEPETGSLVKLPHSCVYGLEGFWMGSAGKGSQRLGHLWRLPHALPLNLKQRPFQISRQSLRAAPKRTGSGQEPPFWFRSSTWRFMGSYKSGSKSLIWVISIVALLITSFIATHEPPSKVRHVLQRALTAASPFPAGSAPARHPDWRSQKPACHSSADFCKCQRGAASYPETPKTSYTWGIHTLNHIRAPMMV